MFRFISLVDPAPSTAASLLPSFPMLKASVIFHWPLRPPRIKTTFPRLPQLGILIWRSSGQWDIIQDITWQFWVPPFQNSCGHNHGGLRVTSWSKCQSSGTLRKLHHTDFTENCYASCRPPISDRFWDRGHLWLILGLSLCSQNAVLIGIWVFPIGRCTKFLSLQGATESCLGLGLSKSDSVFRFGFHKDTAEWQVVWQ